MPQKLKKGLREQTHTKKNKKQLEYIQGQINKTIQDLLDGQSQFT